ncbi:hypothetical protein FisN_16Lh256 [Fistulifera solaris]|uniref:Peptidase M14 carboxypeptidase A domain-containing protein n=1 Tax=Fistulifera solaris TaxID=1519565 RepID=A0A1Z5J6Z4_FISSO|nr:hypothetical protein FisN_16Lh256 [Fistulifera solaris]|eukprot:GAX09561.1 hypothetical protein FisN_16Lh256 [Fistulifera solaris]
MFRFTTTQLLLLLSVSGVWRTAANRDDTYYAEGVVNPNTAHNAMYWKEPSNVLEDLDQFEKLYVQYHECAWSEVLGQNNNGGGDESDTWYLKSVPRMGAQVAYTLHGVLKGHRDRGCSKATYILSAHTNNGITGFTNVLATLGVDGFTAVQNGGEGEHQGNNNNNNGNSQVVTSNCQAQGGQQQHRFLNEGQQQQQGENQKYYYEYNADQTSVAAICQNKRFVKAQISGSSCSGTIEEVVDELTEFNDLLSSKAKCVQIYARGDSYNQQQEGQQQQQNGNNGSPLSLLQNSYSCWYQQPDCPDPYGKQRKYQQAIDRVTSSNLSVQDQETKARAATFLLLSVAFLAGAVFLLLSPGRGGSMPTGYLQRLKSRRRASRKNKMLQSSDDNASKSSRRGWASPDIAQTMSQEVSLASENQSYSYDEQSQRVALSTDTSNDDSSAYPRPPPTHLWEDGQQEAMDRRKGFLSKFRSKKG